MKTLRTRHVVAAVAAVAMLGAAAHAGTWSFFLVQNSSSLVQKLAGLKPTKNAAELKLRAAARRFEASYRTNPAAWTMSYTRWLYVNGVSDSKTRAALYSAYRLRSR